MNRQFSVYLDAIRITASLLVFLTHLPNFIGGWLWQFRGLGHEAVVIFFVLSGFVISYVTQVKESEIIEYFASRFARIYSVALPALILTIFLYYLGNYLNPASFPSLTKYSIADPLITTITAVLFLIQSWWEITVFSNMPYWSLGYEVLYYVFFGVLHFVTGIKRIIWLTIVILVMGPSILLYLPIWLLGVLCYRLASSINISTLTAYILYVISLFLIVCLCLSSVQGIVNELLYAYIGPELISILNKTAVKFGSDYLLAIAIAMNILSFYFISMRVVIFNDVSTRVIRFTSSYTFSIYLYHMPILFFVSAIVPYSEFPLYNIIGSTLVTISIIVVLGNYTEKKKSPYKKLFYLLVKVFTMQNWPNKSNSTNGKKRRR